ncbi:Retrovirus-related Pol polyprotein from transposon 17.6, partial [Dictyocoela roeselum]
GASYNLIKGELLPSDISKETVNNPVYLELVDGKKIEPKTKINTLIQIKGDSSTQYQFNAYVIDEMQTDIIIGLPFLVKKDARIDFKQNILKLDEKEYELLPKSTSENPDQIISDKVKILNIQESERQHCHKILKTYIDTTPTLGLASKFSHTIQLKENKIISKKPFKIPHAIFQDCVDELTKLEAMKVIRKSLSPYSSPAFPIRKKNGKIRIVVDFRELNKITTPQFYPLPSIMDMIQQLTNSKVFSQLDFNSGYYQIPLSEDSIPLTGFTMYNQHYEFVRMPFGLANA